MKSEKGTEKTKIKKILAAVLLLIVFVMVRQQTAESLEHGSLQRKEPGEGSSQKSLEAIVDGESYDINVEIAERRFTKKEAKKELKAAKKEIDTTFLGDNKSLNSIKKPVVMKDAYRNGNVEAEWRLDSYDVINTEGEFVKKELPKEGILLEACVVLSCGEETEEYCFGFHVFSPDLSIREQIETALEKQDQKDKTRKKRDSMERTEFTYGRDLIVTWSDYRNTPKIPGTGGGAEAKEKTGRRTAIVLSPAGNYISIANWSRNVGI